MKVFFGGGKNFFLNFL